MTDLDPAIAGMLAHIKGLGQPEMADLPLPIMRVALAESCRGMEGPPPDRPVNVTTLTLTGAAGPLPGRLYRPDDAGPAPLPVLLFFHGGGFIAGDLDSHDMVCRRLAALSGLCVLAATYRLAPEHPLPAAHDDAQAVLAQIGRDGAGWGLSTERVVIAGDSAGGNIALATALDAPGEGPRVAGVLLFYPVVALDRHFASRTALGQDYLLTERSMQAFTSMAVPDPERRGDARFNPLNRATLQACPPVLLFTAGFDPLCDEGRALADRLAAEDVALTHHHCPSLIHAFIHMTGVTPAVAPLLTIAAQWSRARLA